MAIPYAHACAAQVVGRGGCAEVEIAAVGGRKLAHKRNLPDGSPGKRERERHQCASHLGLTVPPFKGNGPDRGFYMQLANYGSLDLYIGRINLLSREGRELFRQAVEALVEFHRNNLLHRDIKPANFFVNKLGNAAPTLWLGDLGHTMGVAEEVRNPIAGTLTYLPPEYFAERQHHRPRMSRDIWALAATFFELHYARKVHGDARIYTYESVTAWEKLSTECPILSWRYGFFFVGADDANRLGIVSPPAQVRPLLDDEELILFDNEQVFLDLLRRMLTQELRARVPSGEILQHPYWHLRLDPQNLDPFAEAPLYSNTTTPHVSPQKAVGGGRRRSRSQTETDHVEDEDSASAATQNSDE
jgi:serine/threonine protein kinase